LVTSRPYLELKEAAAGFQRAGLCVHLDGRRESDNIKKEIDLVIQHRVATLGQNIGLPSEVQEYLQNILIEMKNGTYLWLRAWCWIPSQNFGPRLCLK
jgi:hypothetical protein